MDEFKVEKCNAENYRYWSMRAQGILEFENLWFTIDTGFTDDELKMDKNKKADHSADSIIYLLINNDCLDDVMESKSAEGIWENLRQIHTKYDTWQGLLLKDFVKRI
ncbi:hypothetical protein JTB14_002139 [Gonioctena quinquepunctata]|nr:hypothetical protein JTB14_002139 [Gonioctena quinquepunctata]